MAPRAGKPSGFLKRCYITVEGSLGRDAKISDVEKWTVNNGGTYSSKINNFTTHVICTSDTYKKDNFALPKKFTDRKGLYFVGWNWLEESLRAKRVKPAKRYLHSGNWQPKVDKKAVKRQALLTGKTFDEVHAIHSQASQSSLESIDSDGANQAEDKPISIDKKVKEPTKKPQTVFELKTFTDKTGVIWEVNLKGSELASPEDGSYVLSIFVTNGEPPYYRAQYLYSADNMEPVKHTVSVGGELDTVRSEFELFYKNKTGKKWSEHYSQLQAMVRSPQQSSEQSDDSFHDAKSEITTSTE